MKVPISTRRCASLPILALLFCASLIACDKTLGYSVVLWHNDEHALTDGEIVRVYIRSNISQVYVIGVPDGDGKVEVPLWQLSEPTSKARAERLAARYADYAHTYASVKLDGLPVRAEAVNTSKQVYRLREKEVIRVLYKGQGQAVTNGAGNMEGEWLRVLTEEGTEGWCFSHNLELFTMQDGAASAGADAVAVDDGIVAADASDDGAADAVLERVKAHHWYPESFQTMIDHKRIDLNRMDAGYGFVIKDSTVSLALPTTSLSWSYSGIKRTMKDKYQFAGAPVQFTVRKSDLITVEYTDSDRKTRAENFVLPSEDISGLVQKELNRRRKELEQLRLFGPQFESSNYGQLTFRAAGGFAWTGYDLLVPSIVSKDATESGTIAVDYFISDALKVSYDGVLTFRFDGMDSPVRFLYKIADGGLRLEDATRAQVADGVVLSRSTSPLIIFFGKK